MADAFAAQQVGRAHRIAKPQQGPVLMGFAPADRAADHAAMAIQHQRLRQIQPLQHGLQQPMQRWLRPAGIIQPAHPHLQLARPHRKHPAVALGHPIRSEQEAEPIRPELPDGWLHLEQPFHAAAAHQRVGGLVGLTQQRPLLAGGIHQPAAADPALRACRPAQQRAGLRAIGLPLQRTPAQPQLGPGGRCPLSQAVAQGAEIENRTEWRHAFRSRR